MDQTYSLESFLNHVQKRDPNQTEFAQAVRGNDHTLAFS